LSIRHLLIYIGMHGVDDQFHKKNIPIFQ
jgi:hypothetical protein